MTNTAYWSTSVAGAFDRDRHLPHTHDEMRAAVHELATRGMTDYGIAAATRLSVEQVRRLLSEHGRGAMAAMGAMFTPYAG